MKIKTSKLIGPALDWAVAKSLGLTLEAAQMLVRPVTYDFKPSTNWALGGPLTKQYKINIHYCVDLRDRNGLYIHAETGTNCFHGYWLGDHEEPLIAAMRCLVASKLGDEVNVPEELC